MRLKDLLSLPWGDRRARSKGRGAAGPDTAISSDASPTLESVAQGLSAILERCGQTMVYRQTIESLVPRLEELACSLSAPIPEREVEEEERRKALKRKLDPIFQSFIHLEQVDEGTWLLNSTEGVDKLGVLVRDIGNAMVDYQTSLKQHKSRLLREATILNSLHPAADAGHRSGIKEVCMEGTGLDALLQLKRWQEAEQDHRMFWLSGVAGTGKSTIVRTFVETNVAEGKLVASFICSRDSEDRGNFRVVIPTLAHQLTDQHSQLRQQVLRVVEANPNIKRESLCSQMKMLIVEPFKSTRVQALVTIDALEECGDDGAEPAILSALSRYVGEIPHVKFLLTGRKNPRLCSRWLEPPRHIAEVFRLHEIGRRSSVDGDIKLFFETRLTNLAKTRDDCGPTGDWPSPQDIDILCKKAAGSFIYASTAVKFITSGPGGPTEALALITSLPHPSRKGKGKPSLRRLYLLVLEQAYNTHENDDGFHDRIRSVVGAVMLISNPLPMGALSTLLGVPDIPTTLRSLHSLLLAPDSRADPIRVFHRSFPKFLLGLKRCEGKRLFIDQSVHHREILFSCLSLMKGGLKENICELENYASISKVEDLPMRRKAQIGDALEYACLFWVKHLTSITNVHEIEDVHKTIEEFFTKRLLFWIETLIIMGSADVVIYAIDDIWQWYTLAGLVPTFVDDSRRFVMEYIDVIRDTPSEIYRHALPLSPSSSWIRESYREVLLQEVDVVTRPAAWGECLCTLPFNRDPRVLAFWKGLIAVGFDRSDIIIIDADVGICVSVLSGHVCQVESLAFSSNGTFLVSGDNDGTIRRWDLYTGVFNTLSGHTRRVSSISVSPDCSTIASGSEDKTIRLWDAQTGACQYVMVGHGENVNSVGFSLEESEFLLSASEDHTVRWWDIHGLQTRLGRYNGVHSPFSSDGAQLVSWMERVATVQKSDSEVTITGIPTHDVDLQHCCFSPNGKFMAGAVSRTVYVWDTTNPSPHPINTFIGHANYITSLTFSSPLILISSSRDRTIRFWLVGTSSTNPDSNDSGSEPPTPVPIASVSLQATDGIAISSNSAGVVRIWDISTGISEETFNTPARGIDQGDARLIEKRLTLGWFADEKIHVWDTEKRSLQTVDPMRYCRARDLRISGEGSKIFLLDRDYIQAWSIQTGEVAGEVKLGGETLSDSIIVDGLRVWICSRGSHVGGWDFEFTGPSPAPLSGKDAPEHSLKFIRHTGTRSTDLSRIEDVTTGKEVFRLSGRHANPTVARWDGRYMVAGYNSGEVLILDFGDVISK